MNLSIITASFPIDSETYNEIKGLCTSAMLHDHYNYAPVLNLHEALNYRMKGFFVLAYEDEQNELVGVASAVDQMGLNTYEWAILIAPMYREVGLDEAILKVIGDGLHQRGAEGELALVIEKDKSRRNFVEGYGYTHSFSEATLEAAPEAMPMNQTIHVRPYVEESDQEALIRIFSEAFGDLREESVELIHYNTSTPGRALWVAEMNGELAGTVTTSKEGSAQWVTALAVHPEKQGLGIGTSLLKWVKDYTKSSGEDVVLLEVEVENERALSVYERAGFLKSMQVDYFAYTGE